VGGNCSAAVDAVDGLFLYILIKIKTVPIMVFTFLDQESALNFNYNLCSSKLQVQNTDT